MGQNFKVLLNEEGKDITCPVTQPMLFPNDLGKIEMTKVPCSSNCVCFDTFDGKSDEADDVKFFGCRYLKIKYQIKDTD
jgi:hypothetical protein